MQEYLAQLEDHQLAERAITMKDDKDMIERIDDMWQDIIHLKMNETALIDQCTSFGDINRMNGVTTRDGWYPLFDKECDAINWRCEYIETPVIDKMVDCLRENDYRGLLKDLESIKVKTVGPNGTDIKLGKTWSGDTEQYKTYYTVVMENGGSYKSFDGMFYYVDDSGERCIDTHETSAGDVSFRTFSDVVSKIKLNVDILKRSKQMEHQSNNLYSNWLFSKIYDPYVCKMVLFSMNDVLCFDNLSLCKTFICRGDTYKNMVGVSQKEHTGNIVFTLLLGRLSKEDSIVLKFHLNDDDNTYFSIHLNSEISLSCYKSNDSVYPGNFQNYTQSAIHRNSSNIIQIKYDLCAESFWAIGNDLFDIDGSEICKVDSEFIFDWIKLKNRRITVSHVDGNYSGYIASLIVTCS